MAGLSTKAIKTRIKSMASTRQITKAMELVASSKLRSAQSRAVACRPYFTALYEAMNEIAWTKENAHGVVQPVGLKAPNALGLYDMIGNVYEHCLDWLTLGAYEDVNGTAVAVGGDVTDPVGPSGNENNWRVRRGGSCGESWKSIFQKAYCRVRYLTFDDPWNVVTGYRLCVELP